VATLVANHQRFLAFLQRRVGNRDDAEDVLQAAFVTGLENHESLRDEESVVAWFFRVLRNAVADRHRRAAAGQRALAARGESDRPGLAAEGEARREVCACLADLVKLLRPDYADVIRRIDLDGGEPTAVAAVLGVTPGNLRVRLHRARNALRQEVERTCRTCATHGCLDCSCGKPPL
jgi:RNA polymerase sigma-70 factor (ECF subfamily)